MTTLSALDCAALISPRYREPVKGVPLLRSDATAGEMSAALDGQTARLDRANGATADVIATADVCQEMQRRVLQALQPEPWWRSLPLLGRR